MMFYVDIWSLRSGLLRLNVCFDSLLALYYNVRVF